MKIIVDNIQTLTSDGTYEFTEMESEEGSVKCYTNPAQLSGIHTITYKSRLTQKKLHKKTDAIFSIYG